MRIGGYSRRILKVLICIQYSFNVSRIPQPNNYLFKQKRYINMQKLNSYISPITAGMCNLLIWDNLSGELIFIQNEILPSKFLI